MTINEQPPHFRDDNQLDINPETHVKSQSILNRIVSQVTNSVSTIFGHKRIKNPIKSVEHPQPSSNQSIHVPDVQNLKDKETHTLSKSSAKIQETQNNKIEVPLTSNAAEMKKEISPQEHQKFIEAVISGDIAQAEELFNQYKIDVNLPFEDDKLLLVEAVRKKNVPMVKLLLDNGAGVKVWEGEDGPNALLLIRSMNDDVVGRELLSILINNKHLSHQDIVELTYKLATSNNIEMLKLLLPHLSKDEMSVGDTEGNTLLHDVTRLGKLRNAQALIEAGADKNAKNNKGWTPLHTAAGNFKKDIALLLIKKGADPKVISNGGDIPAMVAFQTRNRELGTALLEAAGPSGKLWLDLKMMAHRFGIKSQVQIDEGSTVNLEGLSPGVTYQQLHESLKESLVGQPLGSPPEWTHEDSKAVLDSVERSITQAFFPKWPSDEAVEPLIEAINKNQTIIFPTGWSGHSTSILIKGDYLIKCNRGDISGNEPGMIVYKIGDKSLLKEAVKGIIEEDSDYFFNTKINEMLKLEKQDNIPHKDQHSGNCTWASAKLAFRAAVYLRLLENKMSPEKAKIHSRNMYKHWTKLDRQRAIQRHIANTPEEGIAGVKRNFIFGKIHDKLRIPDPKRTPEQNQSNAEFLSIIQPYIQEPHA